MSEGGYVVIFETDKTHVHLRVVDTSPTWGGGNYCAEHSIPFDDDVAQLRVMRCWVALGATFMVSDAMARQRFEELMMKK